MSLIGGVSSYRDNKAEFYADYYEPHKAGKTASLHEGVIAFEALEKDLMPEAV